MKTVMRYLMVVSGLFFSISVYAAVGLERVGPNDTVNGYPLWYQDSNGLALDLCIPKHAGQGDACLTTPAPGDPPTVFPLAFPDNWPDELFWFAADSMLDLDGNRAILVQALEAAFGGAGTPNPGGQVSFARIRIRFNAPYAGDYTVTYPYGAVSFPGIAAGELVFYTVDIGIGAPGDFSGAMGGEVGPFLQAVDSAGNLKPLFTIPDNDGSGNVSSFLSDPAFTTQVTGSPTNFNRFKIEVVADNPLESRVWTTAEFALIGKVHTAPIGSPMKISSALYSRTAVNSDVVIDVHATAVSGPGASGDPVLSMGMVNSPSVKMVRRIGTAGQYFGQATILGDGVNPTYKPNLVTVINSSDIPASSVTVPLVDSILISSATIDAFGDMNIQAVSSDAAVSQLFVNVNDGRANSQVAIPPGGIIPTAFFSVNYPFPPETVTVSSPEGGATTVNLALLNSGARPAFVSGAPLALDDTGLCTVLAGCVLDILSNDGSEADPARVVIARAPVHGTATVNADGTVTYTPDSAGVDLNGIKDSFVYTVGSLLEGLSSNQATVTINPNGSLPVAPPLDPEELSVTRSECRGGKNEWRVVGLSTLQMNHSVTVYAGSTIGGAIIAANVPVDNLGAWRLPKDSGPCNSLISIQSSEGAVLLGVSVTLN